MKHLFGVPHYSVREAAGELDVSIYTVYRKLHQDNSPIPYVKHGRDILIPVEGLKEWIQMQTRNTE